MLFDGGNPEGRRAFDLSTSELLLRGEADADSLSVDSDLQTDRFSTLGEAWLRMGQFARAESLLQRALDQRRRYLGDSDLRSIGSLVSLGLLRKDKNGMADAEEVLRQAVLSDSPQRRMVALGRPLWAPGYVLGLRRYYPEARTVLDKANAP